MAFINTVVGRAAASIWGLKLGNATMNAVLAQVNALGANDAAVAAVVNNAFNSVYGTYSNADMAAAFVNNLGLTGAARDDGIAYTVAQLDAVAADARGGKLMEIADLFSGLVNDAAYGSFARAFNAKVDAAVNYSGQAGTVDSPLAGWNGNAWFTLSGLQDYVVGTPGDDIINAWEFDGDATLQSGDFVDGGNGSDLLYADLINDFDVVTPITRNVESLAFRVQDHGANDGDNNVEGEATTVDAERIDGETRYESNNSRGDLIIEDVRIASSQITKDITIAFVESDPGNVDFGVYFDQHSLRASSAASATLTLKVLDQFGVQGIDLDPGQVAGPLVNNPYDGVRFNYAGRDVQLRDPRWDLRTAETYAELLALIQAALDNEPITNGTGGLPRVTAALGADFTVTASNGVDVTGTSIVLSATGTAVSFAPGSWIASGGVPADSSIYTAQEVASGVSNDLITSTVILDDVGRGSNGGDLVIGGLSVGETSGSKGVEKFDVTVERTSRVQNMTSTNDTLMEVVLKNGLSKGDVSVLGQTSNGFAANDNVLPGENGPGFTHHDAYGFNDVRMVDASAMDGKVTFDALVTQNSFAKYVQTTDTQQDPGGDNTSPDGQRVQRADFEYTGGSNNDSITVDVQSGILSSHSTVLAGREDVTFKINGGNGNDALKFRVIDNGNLGTVGDWYNIQHVLRNVTIDSGSGDDTVRTPGAGDARIYLMDGNDTVYVDNIGAVNYVDGLGAIKNNNADTNVADGEFGMFVFNTADQAGALAAARNRNDLINGTNTNFNDPGTPGIDSLFRATITVTYRGLTSTAELPANVYRPTALYVNQAMKAAINNDPVLSKLLVAQDGPGYTLVVKSLIDGVEAPANLNVTATAFDVSVLSVAQLVDLGGALGLTPAASTAVNIQPLLNSGAAYFNGLPAYDPAMANDGVADITGAISGAISDNTVYPGAGNDVIVLGTGAASNDVVVYSGTFGNDTIVHFTVGGANADLLNLTALGGSGAVADDIVNAGGLAAGALGNVTDGEIAARQRDATTDEQAEVAALFTDSGAADPVSQVFVAVTAGNVGYVWQITDPGGASNPTATFAGTIDLADTDWFTLNNPDFA
ncbi:MAG: hypothetical protein H6931_11480 [Burkholderiaceae bacterium]|nr:hypothetical protein [Burkholderiaceae bacterium]